MGYREFLSKRNIVMAIAILWIMLYHMHLSTGVAWLDAFLGIGYAGSDIFYFVSGIGIWFSLERSKGLMEYYKKRILRVMPMYWCFIGFWIVFRMVCFDLTWPEALANVFAVESFFDIDHAFNWYISFLLVFYLVAPVIKKLIGMMPGAMGVIIIGVVFFLLGYFVVDDKNIMIGLARVPVFTLGMYFGSRMSGKMENAPDPGESKKTEDAPDPGKSKKYGDASGQGSTGKAKGRFSVIEIVTWLILMPIGLWAVLHPGVDFYVSWHNGMLWYPIFFAVPGMYLLTAMLFAALPKHCSRIFEFIGRHTLSIYLIHIFFFEIYEKYLVGVVGVEMAWWHWPVIWVLVAVGCVVLELVTPGRRSL